MTAAPVPPLSRGRIAALYVLYFISHGIAVPYLPLAMRRIGMSGDAIGATMAASLVLSLVTPPLWGYVADRFGLRRAAMTAAAFIGAAGIGAAAVLPGIEGFVAGFLVFVLARTPIGPLLDALTVSHPQIGPAEYGRVRRWGSIGFILAVASLGPFVLTMPPRVIPGLAAACWLVMALALLALDKAPDGATPSPPASLPFAQLYGNRSTWLFLLISALHAACGIPFETYFSAYASDAGLSGGWIGGAWAAGVGLEVVVLSHMGWLLDTLGPRRILLVAYGAGVLRWGLTALLPGGPAMALAQVLHGLTFGACLGASVVWMSRVVPESLSGSAQSVFAAVAWGLGGILGQLVSGPAMDRLGGQALFAFAAAAELVPLAAIAILPEPPPRARS